jgi:hypothetical protein
MFCGAGCVMRWSRFWHFTAWRYSAAFHLLALHGTTYSTRMLDMNGGITAIIYKHLDEQVCDKDR